MVFYKTAYSLTQIRDEVLISHAEKGLWTLGWNSKKFQEASVLLFLLSLSDFKIPLFD